MARYGSSSFTKRSSAGTLKPSPSPLFHNAEACKVGSLKHKQGRQRKRSSGWTDICGTRHADTCTGSQQALLIGAACLIRGDKAGRTFHSLEGSS